MSKFYITFKEKLFDLLKDGKWGHILPAAFSEVNRTLMPKLGRGYDERKSDTLAGRHWYKAPKLHYQTESNQA